MKSARILFMAAFTAVFALGPLTMSIAQTAKSKSQPSTGQQKGKKPAEDVERQDEQTLKLGTQLVTVPFNVTDKRNSYINNLSKDDIEILEDNRPQQVFSFERQTDLPITIAMLIEIGQGLLDDIFRLGRIGDDPTGNSIEPLVIPAHQHLVKVDVARQDPLCEGLIVQAVHVICTESRREKRLQLPDAAQSRGTPAGMR